MGKTGRYDRRWKPDNLRQVFTQILSWFILIVYINLVRVNAIALTQFLLSLSFTTLPVLQHLFQNYPFPITSFKTFSILLLLYLKIKRRPQFPLKRERKDLGTQKVSLK